ncbi:MULTISPECIES: chaperone NapD [unclassified Helicobacter]|uniref:chaperone NapD n=1 Tax=unclassified Helicobacter TaxID=2593540 RepID=UPI000CF07131|nr:MULTISPECIES: chaperone NapD [unclassified Helicobacter]
MNISSIIIKATQENWEQKISQINKIPYTHIELDDKEKGIMIGVIEAPDAQKEIEILKTINSMQGILGADMHLTYNENELKDCQMKAEDIAELIDSKPIEQMKYSGDVNNYIK